MTDLLPSLDRRRFTVGAAAVGLASLLGSRSEAAKPAKLSVGYAALTWGDDNAKRAIAEIAEVGFRGVQLRAPGLKAFADPAALKATLVKARLVFSCLSGGSVAPDPASRTAELDKFLVGARFAKAAGALAVQVNGVARGNAVIDRAALKGFASSLNELGKRTADLGLPLGFHPQANQFAGHVDEVDAILELSDPRYVKLLLDTGHHAAAGGDPAKAIRDHAGRLLMLHLKDVKDEPVGDEPYQFVGLGQGRIDFRAVIAALKAVKYGGWAVVEMRPYSVTEGHSAKDGALANKAFLQESLGLTI